MRRAVELGRVVPLGSPDSTRLFFFSALRFHGKNGWMSVGTLPPAAAQCSKYHVSHFRGLSFHSARRGQGREQRRHQLTTPERPRAVEVLPRHRRAPLQSLRGVIVHRDPRVVHEPPQPLPMRPQAFQYFPARCRKIRSAQFRLHLRRHRGDGLAQAAVGFPERRGVLLHRQAAVIPAGRAGESAAAIPRPKSSTPANLYPPG